MTTTFKLKQSEARILIYLENVDNRFKFAREISSKLRMDYAYLLARLKDLKEKNYIKAKRENNKVYYETTWRAPIEEAKKINH